MFERDALLIEESFGPGESSNRRGHVISRSDQAMRFVRRTGEFAGAPRPKLILLGLKLGGTHGLEVLAELKGDDARVSRVCRSRYEARAG